MKLETIVFAAVFPWPHFLLFPLFLQHRAYIYTYEHIGNKYNKMQDAERHVKVSNIVLEKAKRMVEWAYYIHLQEFHINEFGKLFNTKTKDCL